MKPRRRATVAASAWAEAATAWYSQHKYLDVKVTVGAGMIHHVQLTCPAGSEDVLRGFYGGVLGLEEVAKPPVLAARGGCWFRGHGIELHFGVEQEFRPARKGHPGLLVQDLDAWAGRLRAAGAPVRYDDDFPGMRRFYSEDPHGNRLEFLEPIAGLADTAPAGTGQV